MRPTVSCALAEVARRLRQAGIAEGRREARLLLGHALGLAPEAIIGGSERELTAAEGSRAAALADRRARREPLSRILGRREFWSLPFRVTADTLDPRPDTETLVQAALDSIDGLAGRAAALRLLDLGTGTGCLLLAVLSELPRASGVGVDRSLAAAEIARENAQALGLGDRACFVVGDWGGSLNEEFNLILTNPPYIAEGEIHRLAPEVALFEPRLALAGGFDGLDCYRVMAPDLRRFLAADGRAVVEVGHGQADSVQAIFAESGLRQAKRMKDLGGVERCLVLAAA